MSLRLMSYIIKKTHVTLLISRVKGHYIDWWAVRCAGRQRAREGWTGRAGGSGHVRVRAQNLRGNTPSPKTRPQIHNLVDKDNINNDGGLSVHVRDEDPVYIYAQFAVQG